MVTRFAWFWTACLATTVVVNARSNGDVKICDVQLGQADTVWGCHKFADINQRNRNTAGPCCSHRPHGDDTKKCLNRCCDTPAPIMFWVEAPIWDRNYRYAIRTGTGDPSKDPKTFYAGEVLTLYIKVLRRDAKFRGFLMNAIAVDHGNRKIGTWEFAGNDPNPLYWSSPGCPNSAIQTNSQVKPFTSVLRWRAPTTVDGKPVGKVHFQALIKTGAANHGKFFWSELFLTAATRAPKSSVKYVWVQSLTAGTCSAACKTKGMVCWPEPMQAVKSATAFAPIMRDMVCTFPLLAGCAASVAEKDRCYFQRNSCRARPGCHTALPSSKMMCACGSETDYKTAYPKGQGTNTGGQDKGKSGSTAKPEATTKKSGITAKPEATTNKGESGSTAKPKSTTENGESGSTAKPTATTDKVPVEVDGAPGVHHALSVLPRLLALGAGLLGRSTHTSLLVVAGLSGLAVVDAHNWFHSESRSRRVAASGSPCPMRVGERFSVQVGHEQEFATAWATGHGHSARVLVVHADDLHKVGTSMDTIWKKYVDAAPSSAHFKGDKWKRQHVALADPPHTIDGFAAERMGKPTGKYMTVIKEGDPLYHVSGIAKREAIGVEALKRNLDPKTPGYAAAYAKIPNPLNVFKIADERLKKDKYLSYQNSDLPYVTHAGHFHLSEVNFSESDQIRVAMPKWAKPGHYILIWKWQGYMDCVDIELRTHQVKHPYGSGTGKWMWERIDHCQMAMPFRNTAVCHQAAPSVDQCLLDVADGVAGPPDIFQQTGKFNIFDIFRFGVNVVPLLAPASVNPLFKRSDGASIDIPLDKRFNADFPDSRPKERPCVSCGFPRRSMDNIERCLIGGPLDLAGVTTLSDHDWRQQWEQRADTVPGTTCGPKKYIDKLFWGETSMRQAVQRCTVPACVGIVEHPDHTFSGCATTSTKVTTPDEPNSRYFDTLPKAPDAECAVEKDSLGQRLGGSYRLAVYTVSGQYKGCYVNHGAGRIEGHHSDYKTVAECGALAVKNKGSHFGMEYPQGTNKKDAAQCLLVAASAATTTTSATPSAQKPAGPVFYRKKSAYTRNHDKNDARTIMGASYQHLVTVSFQPAQSNENKPSATTTAKAGQSCVVTLWGGAEGDCAAGNGKYEMFGWEKLHTGGEVAITRNCGKIVTGWVRKGSHPRFETQLKAGGDITVASADHKGDGTFVLKYKGPAAAKCVPTTSAGSTGAPGRTVVDSGAMFGSRSGFEYGWTGCPHKRFAGSGSVDGTYAWFISQLCPKTPKDTALCTVEFPGVWTENFGHPDQTGENKKLERGYKPPPQCKRNTWEIAVNNGWYKVVFNFAHTRTDANPAQSPVNPRGTRYFTGWSHRGCAVEGTGFNMLHQKDLDGPNTYTNWVEVVDGRLTFEDYAGSVFPGGNRCDSISSLKVFKQIGSPKRQAPTWFPQSKNPFVQREFKQSRKVGIVAMLAPDDECRYAWLMHGGAPYCMQYAKAANRYFPITQTTRGYFKNSAIVGISNTPCTKDGGCPVKKGADGKWAGVGGAQICGIVDKARNDFHFLVENIMAGNGHAGMRNRHWVDCAGKQGKYVWVVAPGDSRILPITDLVINQIDVASGDPEEFKDKFACYPVWARSAAEHTPEYITSNDPEDPVFHSTCYMREREIIYLPREGSLEEANNKPYEFNGRCLPCDLWKKNTEHDSFSVPHLWTFADECENCKALQSTTDTCMGRKCLGST